ncbi:MAG: hypothetical protein ACE5L6_05120 [Candidatus Bathyarchaeia archaeon]
MSRKLVGEEVRRRFPRLTMSLVIAIIFWIVSMFIPQTVSDIVIPGLNLNTGFLIGTTTWLFTAIFLIRALSDAIVLSDVMTDIIMKRMGIKEEKPPRRAARDAIYIIVVILVATALHPLLRTLGSIGSMLSNVVTYVALGIILLLIYDIGRILYRMIEQRAELIVDRLVKMAERNRNRR